jgi:hypothetical protein
MRLRLLIALSLLTGSLALTAQPKSPGAERREFLATKAKALKGDAKAQTELGYKYFVGEGVEEDSAEGLKWFRRAADQNFADAQFQLGVINENSLGVRANPAEAAKWYRKAADQNHADAQCALGILYTDGRGVPKNDVEAVKWYRKAAEQNQDIPGF